jgi:hypothetical protein
LNRSNNSSSIHKVARHTLYSDFEGTLVLPEISYKEWALPKVKDPNRFLKDYSSRLESAREKRTPEAWKNYLDLYVGLLSVNDFDEMSQRYSFNPPFVSWCRKFQRAYGYDNIELTILSRGFSSIIRNFVELSENKATLRSLKIVSTHVVASEPQIGRDGLMTGVKSAVFLKRKYVPDGHIMLGDESERKEFERYPYFVNLEKYSDRADLQ